MKIISCTLVQHGPQILAILNEAIANSTAVYDYKPRTLESMVTWFKAKEASQLPVLGLITDSAELAGFASYGAFRAWPAYKYTVEHSIFIHHEHRGKGLGNKLMRALIAHAKARDVHVMVGGIDASNAGSIALHVKLGFKHSGTVSQAAFKFGRWLDLAFYQLTLEGPENPIDG